MQDEDDCGSRRSVNMKLLFISFLHALASGIIYLFPFGIWKRLLEEKNSCIFPMYRKGDPFDLSEKLILLIRRSYFHKPTCLEAALLLHFLLSCMGFRTVCCLGVAMEDEKLIAHAWVELDGKVLGHELSVASFVRVFPVSKNESL